MPIQRKILEKKEMKIIWISKITREMPHKTSRLKMTEELSKLGYDIQLYMAKEFFEHPQKKDSIRYFPTIDFPIVSGFFYGLVIFFYFPFLLHKKKVDVIIIDCTKVWIPFVIPLKILNIPLVLDIRTLPIDRDTSATFTISMYLCRFVVDGITTITDELKKALIERYKLKNIKFGIWSSGVSLEDFDDNEKQQKEHIFQQNKNKFILFYHGDYSPTRGIENLISSINLLNPELKKKIELFIVGMPTEKIAYLSKYIENKNLKKNVKIKKKVEYKKIIQYIKSCDAGIIPLPPEHKWWRVSSPLKTLEYMAAGKPIIATNIPFHQQIFRKRNCGILLNTGNPADLADGIERLYNKNKELKEIGLNCRKIIEKEYTWNKMAKKFETYLLEIIKSKN